MHLSELWLLLKHKAWWVLCKVVSVEPCWWPCGGLHQGLLIVNFTLQLATGYKEVGLELGVSAVPPGSRRSSAIPIICCCSHHLELRSRAWERGDAAVDCGRIYLQCKHVGQESLI